MKRFLEIFWQFERTVVLEFCFRLQLGTKFDDCAIPTPFAMNNEEVE